MPRVKNMLDHHEPLLVAVDYVVEGPRTAAAVAAGKTQLLAMNYQTAEGGLQSVEASNVADVLQGLGSRPRLYNDALFGLAVEAQNELPSPASVDDIDDIRTMLCLLCGGDPVKAETPLIDRAELVKVAIDRARNPLALHGRLSQDIVAANMHSLYREIELPTLAPVLAMTLGGIRVNKAVLEQVKEARDVQMQIAEQQVQELSERPINMESSAVVANYIYDELLLPVQAYTKNGTPSVSIAALEPLAARHPTIPVVLRYMKHKPVRDGAAALLAHVEPSGFVYAELDPLGTATGRFSCCNPNLQGLARAVLVGVEAAPGCVLMEADYSQMELRVLAHFSQDAALLHAFQHDIDLHVRTAARVLGVPEDTVTDQQRQLGKTLNFGIVYGQTACGLADELGISMQRAEALLAAHAAAYPGATAWIASVHQQAANRGEVRTLYGRRRQLPNIYSANPADAAEARRHAVNTIVQGTAADLMKMALIRLNDALPDGVKMLLPVHDSLLLEVPQPLIDQTRQTVTEVMEMLPHGFAVPLKIDIKAGRTWALL